MKKGLFILMLLAIVAGADAQTNVKLYGYELKFRPGAAPDKEESTSGNKVNSETAKQDDAQYLIYVCLPEKDKIFIRSVVLKNKRFDFTVEKISQFPLEWPLSKKQKKVLVPNEFEAQKGWQIILTSPAAHTTVSSKNELMIVVMINGKRQSLVLKKLDIIEAASM